MPTATSVGFVAQEKSMISDLQPESLNGLEILIR